MSHALCVVALDNYLSMGPDDVHSAVAEQMHPFDEKGEWFRDGSRWDWWVIGGRWSGALLGRDETDGAKAKRWKGMK